MIAPSATGVPAISGDQLVSDSRIHYMYASSADQPLAYHSSHTIKQPNPADQTLYFQLSTPSNRALIECAGVRRRPLAARTVKQPNLADPTLYLQLSTSIKHS